jgi:hypothetical protein
MLESDHLPSFLLSAALFAGSGPAPSAHFYSTPSPVSVRKSVIIGALFFVGTAILLFVRPSNDNRSDQ